MDKWLLFFILALCAIGLTSVYSASYTMEGGTRNVIIQSVAFVLGLAVMLGMMTLDYHYLGSKVKIIFGLNIFLLVLVLLVGIGADIGGQSWMRIGIVGIQPSELVKIGFVITFAKHLDNVKEDVNRVLPLFGLILHMGILVGLVLLQPDFGTAMVYVFIFIFMLFASGLHYRYLLIGLGAIGGAFPLAWMFFLKDYQKERFLAFFDTAYDVSDSGYQVMQSKIAIGSGRFAGQGLLTGPQTQLGLLPAKHTDFIFGVIGEEWGFIGSVIVVLLLFGIFFKCMSIAQTAKDRFGSYLCVGIGAMMLFHIFENIGMCLGVMPVTGIPLPFISYGGSYMLTMLMAMGLVMNVAMRRKTLSF